MIIYNIRANGPYEYDKFMLNFGQLYNLVQDAKQEYETSEILEQDAELTAQIKAQTQAVQRDIFNKNNTANGLLNQIALLQEVLL